MRLISSAEVAEVSGAGWWDEFVSLFSGPSGPPGCVPSSNTSGGVTTTQTCGANGVSTVTTSGPGYVIIQNSAPSTTLSGGVTVGKVGVQAGGSGPMTVTTTTCIGGRCSAPVTSTR